MLNTQQVPKKITDVKIEGHHAFILANKKLTVWILPDIVLEHSIQTQVTIRSFYVDSAEIATL
jgi:hypothetical protein